MRVQLNEKKIVAMITGSTDCLSPDGVKIEVIVSVCLLGPAGETMSPTVKKNATYLAKL